MSDKPLNIKLLDIEETFRQKNPRLWTIIPKPFFSIIRKIIREESLNNFITKYGHLHGISFIDGIMKELNLKIEIVNNENIPAKGKYLFVANHPIGGLDGIALMKVLKQFYPEVKFIVNDLLTNIKNFDEFFVPINKHGRQSIANAKLINDVFNSDAQIISFPAGLVSRKINGVISDLKWKKNFITKCIEHKRDIVPVHVSGRNSNLFYNISNLRKLLGIKTNIEMFLLPNETVNHKNKKLYITFGKPVAYSSIDNTKSNQEWASYFRSKVYELAG